MTSKSNPARAAALFAAIFFSTLATSPVAAQVSTDAVQFQTDATQGKKYVSDQLEITFRRGPGTSFAIRRMIKSGTALEVVENNGKGYTRAKLEDGTTGWVLSRFLTNEPVAREKLAEIERRMEDTRQKSALVEEKLLGLNELEASLERVNAENEQLQTELERLEAVASDSLKITADNKVLSQNLENSRAEQRTLIEENERLSDASTQNWFLIGAGVIILGMLIGLTIPNIRWKKKRSSMSGINIDI